MNKIILKYIIFLIFFIVLSNESFSQTDREFWFAAPDFTSGHCGCGEGCPGDDPIYLRFSTFDVSADVKVELPAYNGGVGYIIDEFTMGVQDYYSIDLSSIKSLIETTHPINPPPYETGIKITSNNLISVYYEFDECYNQDIFSLKGKNALGKKFIAPLQNMYRNGWPNYNPDPLSSIIIVATGNGTQVRVKLSQADMEGHAAGSTFDIFLDKGETYPINANVAAGAGHLGGTIIEVIAGADIAITISDDSIQDTGTCWDSSGDQIVPTDVPGKEYIVMKGPLGAAYTERAWVYPVADGATIEVDGVALPGTYDILNPAIVTIPFGSEAVHIKGDTSLYVFHITGTSCELGGALLPTIDGCTGSLQVTYYRSNTNDFWILLMTKAGNEDGFVFEYADGSTFILPDTWFTPVGATGWMVLKNANYKFADAIGGGFPQGQATKIINTKDVFHMGVVNGFNNGTCKYGYFSDFVQDIVSGKVVQSSSTFGEVCENNPLQLFASGGKSYSWTPTAFLDDPTSATPWVTLPAGVHNYAVKITRPCTGDTTLNMVINSIQVPDASFTLSDYTVCAPFKLKLYNNSSLVSDEQNWNFNYDNNPFAFDTVTTEPIDTITHWFYNNTNTDTLFNIRLLVKEAAFGNPCVDTFFNQIHVKPEIYAGFDQNNLIGCNPLLVQFTDTSSGNLDKYKWTFGDGGQQTVASPQHEYKHVFINDTIDYDVELVVTSPYFCKDTARAVVSVFPYIEGGFTIDRDEGCSPYNVKITNISSGADIIFLDYGDGQIDTLLSFSSINHIYANNDGVDEVDTNIIVMRVKNDEGCEFIDRDTILVYPEIQANYSIDGNNYEGCNSRTVTFTNTSNDGVYMASRYLWEFDDGTSIDTTNNTIDKFYNNTTANDKTYNFRLTARSIYGCTDDTTNSIDIYRAYANFTVNNNEGCSPVDVSITNISIGNQIPAIGGWNWDYGDGIGTDIVKNPFPYTYNNNGFENDTNKLVLEVTGTNGCSTRDSVDIVVYPQIRANYTTVLTPVTSCDSLIAVFNSNIIHPGLAATTIYTWDFGDGASSSDSDPTHVYKNLSSATLITRRVDLHVETPLGCSYDISSFIDVYPLVNAKFTVDKITGCSPLTVDAIATTYIGIPAANYNWTYGDGYNPNISNPPAHIYPVNPPGANDTWMLRLDVSDLTGTCTDFATKTITVYDEALADFNPKNSTDCDPYTLTFDNLSINSVAYKWDFDDGGTTSSAFEPTYTFINNTAATKPFDVELEVTSNEGCTNIFTSQVNVLPEIIPDFDINISEGCSPLTVKITNNSIGTEFYWYWDKDDNVVNIGAADSVLFGPTITKTYTNNSGVTRLDSLTIIVGNGNGCYEIYKRAIKVHTAITAQFIPVNQEGCNPFTVNFTNTNILAGGTYTWTFDDGSSSPLASPSHTFINNDINDKTYTVRLEAESLDGCTDYMETDIKVYSKVISGFSIENGEGCPPFYTSIDNTSVGNVLDTYQWLIDNVPAAGAPVGTDRSNFNNTYGNLVNTTRNYEVKLIATNPHGCTSVHTDIVKVYEYVEASFSMDVNNGCAPLKVTFTDLSYVPASTVYSWNYGDGSSSGTTSITHPHLFYNPSRTNSLTSKIDLTVQSSNYCTDKTSLTVEIFHQPLANLNIDNTSSCPPLKSILSNFSQGEDSFEWRFGDGNPNNTTDANLPYEWDNTDIDDIQYYELILWVGTDEGCTDSDSITLSVFPKVIADFTIDNNAGCSPLEDVNFTNTSTSPAKQFFWSFGDGTVSSIKNPEHDFVNILSTDKIYNIRLLASSENNCQDDTTKQITVYVQPDVEFYMNPKLLVFPNNIVGLTNLTNFGPFAYNWSFGDINNSTSTTDQPNSFEYEHWGEKIISLEVNSTSDGNCTDIYIDTLLIMPPLVNADFMMDINAACLNDNEEITFTAFPVIEYGDGYEYEWDFGDDTEKETGEVVYHTFNSAGLYFVKLVARSTEIGREEEEDFVYKPVRIYANPIANIEVSPKISMLNSDLLARVEFFNLSECSDTSGCSYMWDFGDGGTAISKDVTHNYTEIGVYDVSLLVTTASGCKDSILLEDEVSIIGEGDIKFPNAFTPNGDGLNDSFKPVSKGVIKYEMYVYNRWGELIFTTKDLDAGWNGKINGDFAKPDVYVWKAEGKFTNGRSFELAGDITLIR